MTSNEHHLVAYFAVTFSIMFLLFTRYIYKKQIQTKGRHRGLNNKIIQFKELLTFFKKAKKLPNVCTTLLGKFVTKTVQR